MSRLTTIREQKHQARMERFRAMQERMAMLGDGLTDAEERLAEKREAELRARAAEIERRLPVITAQLGLLWHEVMGSGTPTPSGMQLTTTGTEMTPEEHVFTAETHLRYAEGHLQPSEEHLADAEVHLKLVKAHLAVLESAGSVEVNLVETVPPPVPRVPTKESGAAPAASRKVPKRRARTASAAKKRDSTDEPEAEEKWECPINECRESAIHPLDSGKGFGDLSVTKRRKMLKERNLCECCLTDCRDKET
jgi:hypothetical protein